jgi:hypothetical protein
VEADCNSACRLLHNIGRADGQNQIGGIVPDNRGAKLLALLQNQPVSADLFCNVIVVSAGDDIMPFSDFLFKRGGLGAIVGQRIIPEWKMHRRFD